MQTNNQLEIALLRIGSTLFAHIVASCFAKVQTTDGDFAHLPVLEIDSVKKAATNKSDNGAT